MEPTYVFIFLLFFPAIIFCYTEPPYIPVTKPVSTNRVTVCPGCAYSDLSAVEQVAQPGWLITVQAGTYPCLSWTASGELGNEIVIEAGDDGEAIFSCSGSGRMNMYGSHIIFDGGPSRHIIMDGTNLDQEIVFYPQPGIDNIYLSRIVLRNNDATLVRGGGDNFHVFNCEITGSNSVGLYGAHGNHHEIRNNIIHDNKGTGIQYNPHNNGWSNDDIVISGNLIFDNGLGGPAGDRPGISLLSSDNALYSVYVFNNMFWGNQVAGVKKEDLCGNCNIRVYHNTLFNNVEKGFWFKQRGQMDIRNNIVYNNGAGENTNWSPWGTPFILGSQYESNTFVNDPQFLSTDPTSSNFLKIPDTSSAIGYGTTSLEIGVDIDFFGNPRDSSPDAGAHEWSLNNTPTASSPVSSSSVSKTPSLADSSLSPIFLFVSFLYVQ